MKKSTFGLVVTLLALAAISVQCCPQPASPTVSPSPPTNTPEPAEPPGPTNTPEPTERSGPPYVNLNLGGEPRTADPKWAIDSRSRQVTELLFLGLTDFDAATGEPVPELAEEWKVSADGLKWTFDMRDDVYWVKYDPASGTAEKTRPVTAHDVVYSVIRTLAPDEDYHYGHDLHVIKGAAAYHYQWDPVGAETVGVRALDDYTVEFELEEPAGYFPGVVGTWVARPVPQEAIEEHGDKWTEPGSIWTNGPYLLDTWEHEDDIVMVKNPEYPDAASIQIETINWFMVSTDAALAMYENSELDVASVPDADLDRVQADPVLSKELYATPRLCTYYFGFNTTTPPVDNPHVRRALSYAVDRQTLVDAVLRGGQKPAYTFASPGVSGSPVWLDPDYAGGVLGPETRVFADPDYAGIEFDPEEARRQMEAAGYPGGEGLPKLTLTYNQDHKEIARAIQANWKDHLGIEVEPNGQTRDIYHETLRGDTPQIYDEKVCLGNYPDEHNWMGRFHSTWGASRILWSNSEFDQLTEQAAAESDPAKRKDLYARAEEILCVDEAGIVPIYYYTQATLTKPHLGRTLPRMGAEHVDEWRWP